MTEEEFQYKIKIQSLLEASGFEIFKADLDGFMEFADAQTQIQLGKGHLSADGLELFNYNLGRKSGLEMVLNLLAQYAEELVGDNVKSQS